MSTPPINLTELEYQEIFDSIKTYIKSKSDFSDFDFDGSALSALIDIMAYNTHYHVLFQNILVNEMFIDSAQKLESLISHAKLHGYTVQNRISSSATLRISSAPVDSGIAAFSRLTASKTDGTVLNFYNIEDVCVDGDPGEATFTVYEANRAVIDQRIFIDEDTQVCSIPDKNMDIRTLKVFVGVGANRVEYYRGNSTDSNIYENENIYFLENTTNGFDVIFSSRVAGTPLNTDDVITFSYLVSSGSNGNGASGFSFVGTPSRPTDCSTSNISGILNSTSGLSKGGLSTNLNSQLKFLIPRTFSSQNRFVTKSDIISGVYDAGFASSTSNVTVGATPTEPGKVFIKTDIADGDTTIQTNLIDLCNSKSILGIVFSYGDVPAGT